MNDDGLLGLGVLVAVVALVLTSGMPLSTVSAAGPESGAVANGIASGGDAPPGDWSVADQSGPDGPAEPADGQAEKQTGTIQRSTSTAGTTTIEGRVRYQNESGGLEPARQVTIKIRKDAVGPTNPKIAETTTNDSGYYSLELDVGEHESGWPDTDDVLHLHVQALTQNPAVNVVNFGKNLDTANGNTHTMNREEQVTIGQDSATYNFTATDQEMRRAFQVANWTLEAYRAIDREVGWTRNRVKARYPAANDDNAKFKSPLEKFVIGSNRWKGDPRGTVHHEYGHATMSGLFGYSGWQIPHYKGSHCIWSETGRIFAWYEGFAQFTESVVDDDPDVHPESIESYKFYDDGNYSRSSCPDSDTGDFDGIKVEGSAASILWDVYDPANEAHDEINGSLGEVYNAVNETDNKAWGRINNNARTRDLHDFFIQYVDNTGRHEELRKIYFEYGINKPDRFEHDYSGSGDCVIHGYPCSKLDAEKWSEMPPNASVDVGLHHRDDDYYRFDVKEEQRVTVNATVTDKSPTGTGEMRIVVSQSKKSTTVGPAIGNYSENYPQEEVTFTAPETGTYYVHVYDESSRNGGNLTYTLNVTALPQPPQTNEEDDTPSEATELDLFQIGQFVNMTEETAATARYDHDYYEISLSKGERILNASLRDAPGLELGLEDSEGTELQRVGTGETMNTTSELAGTHYFNVSGHAPDSPYTLNVTTQRISQKYEDNDARSAAADLDGELDLDPDPQVSGGTDRGHRGSTTWCKRSNDGNPATGTSGGSTTGSSLACPRHYWWDSDRVTVGFEPHEHDWYSLSVDRHERIEVTIPDDRLGIELYEDGTKVAETPAGASERSVEHTAQSSGRVYINVTGDEYVPVHDMQFVLVDSDARDRLEPNDDQSTATDASTPGGGTETYDLLKLAAGDEDYFAVYLDDGDDLNATVTHLESAGDVTLTLVDPNDDVAEATDQRQFRDSAELYAELTASESGTHYVRVASGQRTALKYNLTIQTDKSVFALPLPGDDSDEQVEPLVPDVPDFDPINPEEVLTPEEISEAVAFEDIDVGPEAPIEDEELGVAVREESPEGVPPLEQSLPGHEQYLEIDHEGATESATEVRVTVSREVLEEHDVETEELAIYRRSDDGEWEPVETSVVEEEEGRIVFEGNSDGSSTYAIGIDTEE